MIRALDLSAKDCSEIRPAKAFDCKSVREERRELVECSRAAVNLALTAGSFKRALRERSRRGLDGVGRDEDGGAGRIGTSRWIRIGL